MKRSQKESVPLLHRKSQFHTVLTKKSQSHPVPNSVLQFQSGTTYHLQFHYNQYTNTNGAN